MQRIMKARYFVDKCDIKPPDHTIIACRIILIEGERAGGGGGKGGRRKCESQVGAWGGWGFAGYIPIEHFDTAFSKITENAFTIAKELFNYKLSAQCLLYRGW